MLTKKNLLEAVGRMEPSNLNEILRGLKEDDKPTKAEEWRRFFGLMDEARDDKLVTVVSKENGHLISAQLTELGVEWLRQF